MKRKDVQFDWKFQAAILAIVILLSLLTKQIVGTLDVHAEELLKHLAISVCGVAATLAVSYVIRDVMLAIGRKRDFSVRRSQ